MRAVLKALRAHKRLSRTELGRFLAVSPATVSNWVQELMDRRLVEEEGAKGSKLGRPMTYLHLRCQSSFAVVADVAHNGVTIAVVDFCGEIVAVQTIKFQMEDYSEGTEFLFLLLQETMERYGHERVTGVSIIIPGIWDFYRRHLVFSSSLPKWVGMDVLSRFSSKYSVPVFIENDANAAAVGQMWLGGMQPKDDALIILTRLGIGSAVVHARDTLRGDQGVATGLGHMVVDLSADAPSCRCGNKGCIEAIVLQALSGKDPLTKAAEVQMATRALAAGSANLVNLLGLKYVIVVNQSWDCIDSLWPLWVEEMRKRIMPHLLHQVRFQISSLGSDATLLGGAWRVFDEFILTIDEQEAFTV